METLIVSLIGITVIVGSSVFLLKVKKLKKNGLEAEGVIFEIIDSDTFSLKYKTPVIRFLDFNDNWITESSDVGIYFGQYKQGENVAVIYDKDNPKKFILRNSRDQKLAFLLLGLGFALLGLAVGFLLDFKL